MKNQAMNAYPHFNSCSCDDTQCEHYLTRWASADPLGASHNYILPELMRSMGRVRVHWVCFSEQ